LKESRQRHKIGECVENRGKTTLEKEENQRQENKLQSGKNDVEQLESGHASTWSNGWIEEQPILS
jgi:hypothetical protein